MTYNQLHNEDKSDVSQWNFIYVFLIVGGIFSALIFSVIRLQLVEGAQLSERADRNEVELTYSYPNRGVIYDRDGNKVAENVAATNLFMQLNDFYEDEELNEEKLDETISALDEILGENWLKVDPTDEREYTSPKHYILTKIADLETKDGFYARFGEIELASDLNNDQTIKVKAHQDTLSGVYIEEGSQRKYTSDPSMSHILGYTSIVTAEDLDDAEYLGYEEFIALNGFKDNVGKLGVEWAYDEELIGKKGVVAIETDAYGNPVSDISRDVEPLQDGKNLHLSISSKAQKKMYETLLAAIDKYEATGAAGIVQDVETGEIIVLVSAPTFNNNDFVGGITQQKYSELLNNPKLPLLNRTISAQLPPGSTFKTLTATAALDAGAINRSTVYTSRAGYTFSDGAPFQEYHNKSYGPLTVDSAIMVSSNIFFCETIRNWNIKELVPYYEAFGIGATTGVDLPGEMPGRLPSPSNKIALANTPGITWLDPIWYPEGDGCNSVIGQGITLVTPLQMSNWIAAIANGGTLNTPHVAVALSNGEEESEEIQIDPIRENVAKEETLKAVREGMRNAVVGSTPSVWAMTDSKIPVAAKTGTAEFGAINSEGIYEHTHAWVTGFFPYEDPKYSFVLLLEDGGESYYSAGVMKEYLDWWAENMIGE